MVDSVSDCCYCCWFPTPGRQNGSVLCGNGKALWSAIGEKIFPLVSAPVQYIWIAVQLILGLVVLGLSIASTVQDTTTFDIVQLVLAIVFVLLAFIDGFLRIVQHYRVVGNRLLVVNEDSSGGNSSEMGKGAMFQDVLCMFSDIFLYPIIMCSVLKHASSYGRIDTNFNSSTRSDEGIDNITDFNFNSYEGIKFIFLALIYLYLLIP